MPKIFLKEILESNPLNLKKAIHSSKGKLFLSDLLPILCSKGVSQPSIYNLQRRERELRDKIKLMLNISKYGFITESPLVSHMELEKILKKQKGKYFTDLEEFTMFLLELYQHQVMFGFLNSTQKQQEKQMKIELNNEQEKILQLKKESENLIRLNAELLLYIQKTSQEVDEVKKGLQTLYTDITLKTLNESIENLEKQKEKYSNIIETFKNHKKECVSHMTHIKSTYQPDLESFTEKASKWQEEAKAMLSDDNAQSILLFLKRYKEKELTEKEKREKMKKIEQKIAKKKENKVIKK